MKTTNIEYTYEDPILNSYQLLDKVYPVYESRIIEVDGIEADVFETFFNERDWWLAGHVRVKVYCDVCKNKGRTRIVGFLGLGGVDFPEYPEADLLGWRLTSGYRKGTYRALRKPDGATHRLALSESSKTIKKEFIYTFESGNVDIRCECGAGGIVNLLACQAKINDQVISQHTKKLPLSLLIKETTDRHKRK